MDTFNKESYKMDNLKSSKESYQIKKMLRERKNPTRYRIIRREAQRESSKKKALNGLRHAHEL